MVKYFLLLSFVVLSQFVVAKGNTDSDSMSVLCITISDNTNNYSREKLYKIITNEAIQYVGTPYKMGGISTAGFDCSGFIWYLYNKYGITLPRISKDQANEGKRRGKRKVRYGDLLFFKGSDLKSRTVGHVGMVITGKNERVQFIHASTSKGVVVSNLDTEYYALRFIKARKFKALKKKVKR